VVQNGVVLPLEPSIHVEKEFMLTCKRDIEKGSFVCEYAGEIIGESEARKRSVSYQVIFNILPMYVYLGICIPVSYLKEILHC